MACINSRYNEILLSLVLLLLYCSLSQCTALKRKKFNENSISLSKGNGERLYWSHGKLLIGLKTEGDGKPKEAKTSDVGDVHLDYQSDMTWDIPGLHAGQDYSLARYDNAAVERLLKMDPLVDCSGGSMRLQVQDADSKPGSLLFVDRGDLSPLPLSKLPKSCGYKIGSMRRDLIMVAPYDGCFVVVEESRYVLPLRWFGLPVRMSCPLSKPSSNPPMVTCHAGGMVVKTNWALPPSELKVNLNDKWEPLTEASSKCGFGIVQHPEGVAIYIGYNPCMQKKDGMYSMKLFGDGEVKLSCPSLALADSTKEPIMDFGSLSTPAPTQNVIITPQVPNKPSLSQTWHQFYPLPWYPPQPKPQSLPVQLGVPLPADDKMVGQPFYPLFPEQPLPDRPTQRPVEEPLGQFYNPLFYPQEPTYEEPAYASQPEYPYQEWYLPKRPVPQPAYPFFIPQEPVKPTEASEPQTTKPPNPEGPVPPPFYLYPIFHPTVVPTTTASPPQVPQRPQYQFFGPYYYPLPSQHLPHTTPPPTPSPQKPQDPPVSQQDTVLPSQTPQPNAPAKPMECTQYCPDGIPNCCPQIAFHHHQHLHHFVPLEKNDNVYPPAFPNFPGLSRFTSRLRPDLGYAAQTAPQEAQAPQSRPAFTNVLASPQFPSLGGQHEEQTYQQPPESNTVSLHDRSRQIDTKRPPYSHIVPNVFFPYKVNMTPRVPQSQTLREPQSQPPSGVAPNFYSENFDPVHRRNLYVPYNMQSSQQSDGPFSNSPPKNLLSRIRQYTSQFNMNGPSTSGFRSQPDPHLVSYHTLQESQDNFSKDQQPFNVFKKPAKREETGHLSPESRSYVLLQSGPPGRSVQSPPFRPVVASDNGGQNLASEPQNKPPQLQGDSEDLKWLVKENLGNSDLTLGDEPGPPPQTASVGPNSAPLSQEPAVSGNQSFRDSQKHFLPFGYRRKTAHPNVLQ